MLSQHAGNWSLWEHSECSLDVFISKPSPEQRKLLGQSIRNDLRTLHYGLRTGKISVEWVKRFLTFHEWRKPSTMSEPEINAFLTHLAVDRNVAESTQTQALSALLFMYKNVLGADLDYVSGFKRRYEPRQLPVNSPQFTRHHSQDRSFS
jgi:hypothetical protein